MEVHYTTMIGLSNLREQGWVREGQRERKGEGGGWGWGAEGVGGRTYIHVYVHNELCRVVQCEAAGLYIETQRILLSTHELLILPCL